MPCFALGTSAKGVQFYCPSRTYTAIRYWTIFPFLAQHYEVEHYDYALFKKEFVLLADFFVNICLCVILMEIIFRD